jgi:hypothetical protein
VEHQTAASIFLALQESALGHVMRSSPALYRTPFAAAAAVRAEAFNSELKGTSTMRAD